MAISFEKHRQEIIAAWKDVLDDKSTTEWSLFGYEGQTNELHVVSSGEGGLEELCEDLNSSKIMYAFVRIDDPKTCVTKFLLINWQGEAAPILRKGTCANHISDVQKFLSGAHLIINARTEDDIDKERILKQLSSIGTSGTALRSNSKETLQSGIDNEIKLKIGTNYNRVIPSKELNPTEMQNFWKKEEEEERHRVELEKERKRLELLKREEELRAREEKEFTEREKKIQQNNELKSNVHIPIKTSPQPLNTGKIINNATINSNVSGTRVMTEAERMRQQRSQEAKELIGSRVGTAKAIFIQNSSDGQIHDKSKNVAPVKPVRNSIAHRINALNNQQQQPLQQQQQETNKIQTTSQNSVNINNVSPNNKDIPVPVTPEVRIEANDDGVNSQQQSTTDDFIIETEEQYSTIKRSPHNKTNSLTSPDEGENNITLETLETANQEKIMTNKIEQMMAVKNNNEQNDIVSEEDIIYQDVLSDGGLKAKALYDYQAADESEITFDPGDIITHIDQIDEGWWQGLGPDGTYGLFPANYVELIN